MSSFVANATPVTPQRPIAAGPFWPEIDLAALRESIRLPGDIPAPRLRSAAVTAVLSVTRELAHWQACQEAAGHLTLADIPALHIDGTTATVLQYRRAVYCATAVELHERYRSYDATAQGNQRAEDLTPTIEELRRDLRNAISDLTQASRLTVELI